jgi:hypothetical protein
MPMFAGAFSAAAPCTALPLRGFRFCLRDDFVESRGDLLDASWLIAQLREDDRNGVKTRPYASARMSASTKCGQWRRVGSGRRCACN